jgi:hypothetical protein
MKETKTRRKVRPTLPSRCLINGRLEWNGQRGLCTNMVVTSGFVLATLLAAPLESLAGLGLKALGIALYLHWREEGRRHATDSAISLPGASRCKSLASS